MKVSFILACSYGVASAYRFASNHLSTISSEAPAVVDRTNCSIVVWGAKGFLSNGAYAEARTGPANSTWEDKGTSHGRTSIVTAVVENELSDWGLGWTVEGRRACSAPAAAELSVRVSKSAQSGSWLFTDQIGEVTVRLSEVQGRGATELQFDGGNMGKSAVSVSVGSSDLLLGSGVRVAAGVYPDGSNLIGLDPDPPLSWAGREDLEGATIWGDSSEPYVNMVRAHLMYHQVRHKQILASEAGKADRGQKPGYHRLVPVLDVGNRTVNDHFVINRHIVEVLYPGLYNQELEEKIAYELLPSAWNALGVRDFKRFIFRTAPDLGHAKSWMFGAVGRPFALHNDVTPFQEALGSRCRLRGLAEICRELRLAAGAGPFLHGQVAGPSDLSLYGGLAVLYVAGIQGVWDALSEAELEDWWGRMEVLLPLADLLPAKAFGGMAGYTPSWINGTEDPVPTDVPVLVDSTRGTPLNPVAYFE